MDNEQRKRERKNELQRSAAYREKARLADRARLARDPVAKEKKLAGTREWAKRKRREDAAWRAKRRAEGAEWVRSHRDDAAYRARKVEAMRRYRSDPRNREKLAARWLVGSALRRGRLVRGPCERCGTSDGVQAHHDDYLRPLDVRWLCRRCHNAEHDPAAAAS